jgi:enoyl-[acyl-carrier protein] reductase/trans-2-enoyl-CoA reductase (NAD+)
MFAVTAEILKERGQYQTIPELAAASMAVWKDPLPESEVRLDGDFQAILPEFHRRAEAMKPADVPGCFEKLIKTGF